MNTLLDRHKDLIDFLSKKDSAFSLEDVLVQFFFNEEQGRALIFQNIDRYAVLYLKKQLFSEEKEKGEQLEKFWDLITFIKYLKDNHYIYPMFSHDMNEKIVVIHDVFKNPKIEKNRIVLDEDGDFTSQPEMINSKEGDVLYEGIIYKRDYYKSVINNVLGTFKKAAIFEKLLENTTDENKKNTEEVDDNELGKKDINVKKNNEQDKEDSEKQGTTKNKGWHNLLQNETKKVQDELASKKETPKPTITSSTVTKGAKPNTRKLSPINKILLLLVPVLGVTTFQGIQFHNGVNTLTENDINISSKLKVIDSLIKSKKRSKDYTVQSKDSPNTKTLYGIDISRYNNNVVDDLTLSDSLKFVICKATQGAYYVDPFFMTNWKSLKEKKIVRGAYHFFDPGVDAIKQATHFLNTVEFSKSDITPIVDVEKDSVNGTLVNIDSLNINLKRFLEFVEKKTNRVPMIYVDSYFSDTYLKDTSFVKYPLWLADYTRKKSPRIPKIWQSTGFKIWQKTDKYNLDNIHNCLDVFYGDITALTSN